MKIRHLAIVPAFFLMTACGGSTPEPETPAGEAAGASEQKPAEGGGEAAPADKPADAPADDKK